MPILPISSLRAAVTNAGGTPTQYTHVGLLRELITAWGGTPTQWAINPLLREAISAASGTPTKHDTIYLLRELVTALGGTPTGFNGGALWDQVASLSASIGGSPVNTVAPSISGTRGGTLNLNDGVWTGAAGGVTKQLYVDGVATGAPGAATYNDTDPSTTLELRETALPGSVVASGYLGALASASIRADNFDDNSFNSGLYVQAGMAGNSLYAVRGTIAETGGQATVTPQASTTGYNGYKFISPVDFTGCRASIRYVSGTNSSSENGYFTVGPSTDESYQFVEEGGTLYLRRYHGTPGTSTAVASFAYSATTHAWLAIRHNTADNTIHFETAPSTASSPPLDSEWVDRGSISASVVPITSVYVGWGAGTWGSVASPATIKFDNFRLVPSGAAANNIIYSAVINQQSGGSPGQKQIDITASIGGVGATGAQYKVETEAGELVQGWTAMALASGTATASCALADHAHEGEKFRALVRNVGGTVQTIFALTGTNGYVMSTPMQLGMNDQTWAGWAWNNPGRDWFESRAMGIIGIGLAAGQRQYFLPPGTTQDNYLHWAEEYNPAQLYPDVNGSDNYRQCRYQGIAWRTTDATAQTRPAPSTADLAGTTTGWTIAIVEGGADGSIVGMTADGLPTKLPDDPNLTIFFDQVQYPPKAHSDVGFTVNGATQPGVSVKLIQSMGTSRTSAQNIPAGTFTVTYDATTYGQYNGLFYVDRATSTSALDSSFFLSGIPSYETGTPSADIGSPYAAVGKRSDISAFVGMRYLGSLPINREAGNWAGTFTAANSTVAGARRDWKYMADTANVEGHQVLWVNVPDIADTTWITAFATFLRDNVSPSVLLTPELSNERWNGKFQQAVDLNARAAALPVGDAAYNNPWLLHCREHNAMVAIFKSVFGAAYATRVSPQLAWQTVVPLSTLEQGLDFENTYLNVGMVSIAPYVDGGIGVYNSGATGDQASMNAAILANNQTNFNTALTSYLAAQTDYEVGLAKAIFDSLPGYSMSKGLGKNAIQMSYYEAGFFQVTYSTFAALGAGCDTIANTFFTAYKRSNTGLGARFAYYIDQLAQKAPGLMMVFQLYGTTGLQFNTTSDTWGLMDGIGQVTQEPFATVKAKALAYN